MKEKEYTTEDWVAIHQEFFTLAREITDIKIHGKLLSLFVKAFNVGLELGFEEGMNFEKLQQISEKFMHPPLKANEQVNPDPDHSQYIAGKMEGVDRIAYKKGKVDPFLPQDIW